MSDSYNSKWNEILTIRNGRKENMMEDSFCIGFLTSEVNQGLFDST